MFSLFTIFLFVSFQCNEPGCDWAFTTAYKLKRHIESHQGRKDYIVSSTIMSLCNEKCNILSLSKKWYPEDDIKLNLVVRLQF